MPKISSPISDDHITSLKEDKLGRRELVNLLLDSIEAKTKSKNHKALAFGIFGDWGEGKTSFMKSVETELIDKYKIKTIWYDPWAFYDFDKLYLNFFEQLSSLTFDNEELSTAIISYGRELIQKDSSMTPVTSSYLMKLKQSLPGIGEGSDQKDLSGLKKSISDKLREKNIHVVVFVDDIDRLLPNEIQLIFKLTRQIADFDNVIYILGFDPNVVAHVLKKVYGTSELGRAYMEKMVQVPIVLPVIQELSLENYLESELTELLSQLSLNLPKDRIKSILDKISFAFNTKRSIIRYINQLRFVCPLVIDITNIEDLCLIELLKFFDEQAWMQIYKKKKALLKISKSNNAQALNVAKEMTIKSISSSFPRKYISFVQNILTNDLFPNKKGSYRLKSINHPLCFTRYFLFAHDARRIDDTDFKELEDLCLNETVDRVKVWINKNSKKYTLFEIERAIFYVLDNI